MSNIAITSLGSPTDPKLKEIARNVAISEIGAFRKAVAHLADALNYPMPVSLTSAEQLYLRMLRTRPNVVQQKAIQSVMPMVQATDEKSRRFSELVKVNFKSAEPVAKQLKGSSLPNNNAKPFPVFRIPVNSLPTWIFNQPVSQNSQIKSISGDTPIIALPGQVAISLRALSCERMTSKTVFEPDPDSINIGAVFTDATGDTVTIPTLNAGRDFRNGVSKSFTPPHLFAALDLEEATSYPKNYHLSLVMAELDDGGNFEDDVRTIFARVRDEVAKAIQEAITAGLATYVGAELARAIATVVSEVLKWLANEIFGALGNDVFRPQLLEVSIPDRESLENPADVSRTIIFEDHGGRYSATFGLDWIRVGPEVPRRRVDSLRIAIRTGGDDLRGASWASAFVRFGNGAEQIYELNRGAGWGNGSVNSVTVPVPPGMKVQDLKVFGVRFRSGQPNFWDTGDNWNMDWVRIEYIGPDGVDVLLEQSGAPLVRFTENTVREWSTSIKSA